MSTENCFISMQELWRCYLITRQHKANKPAYLRFELNLFENLRDLYYELNTKNYHPKESTVFPIEHPVKREVICADVSDRIVQTYFVLLLTPQMEEYMSNHSFSCRVGKGSLNAALYLHKQINKKTFGYLLKKAYLYKIDMHSFFPSIDTKIWCERLIVWIKKHIKGKDLELLIYLTKKIYMSKPQMNCRIVFGEDILNTIPDHKRLYRKNTYIGIPIGNRSSQMFVNFVTTTFLKFMDKITRCNAHYTDDNGGLIVNKRIFLRRLKVLRRFLKKYFHLNLHPDKFYLQHYSKGMTFLGYRFKYDRILPSKRLINNFQLRVKRFIYGANNFKDYIYLWKDKILSVINSYLGMMRHTSSYRLRKEEITKLMASKCNIVFVLDEDAEDKYLKIMLKENYTNKYYLSQIAKNKKKEILL